MGIGKTAGIVAEFNPFHNGHALLIKRIKESGYSNVVVVMSGNYTQRGEAACMLKEARVRAALLGGADLVFELPLPWAISSAEKFAYGAVSLISACGCADALFFGSECGDTGKLVKCAERLLQLDGSGEIAKQLAGGCSFPKARAAAVGTEFAEILKNPNDTLAVEYLKAIFRLHSNLTPCAVKRIGARHDGPVERCGGVTIASASAVREIFYCGKAEDATAFMPKEAGKVLAEELAAQRAPYLAHRAESLILEHLRRLEAEDFKALPDVSEGLENRIYRASRTSCSLEELYRTIKSKRYTLSRIRRIVLCAFLGVDRTFAGCKPPYLRVLGFTSKGQLLLREAKKSATQPIITRHADIARLDDFSRRVYALECRATDLYGLCLPKILPCGLEQKFKTVRIDS